MGLRYDLAEDVRLWLDQKLVELRESSLRAFKAIPARLPADTLVFNVPTALDKIFNRDLAAAGIVKRDDRGRTLDVHALRTTFGTLLSKGGVPLRTAQAAMRHSDPSLAANVYTDPRLLDVHGTLDALPGLDLAPEAETMRATGTEGRTYEPIAPLIALNPYNPGHLLATDDNMTCKASFGSLVEGLDVTSYPVNEKGSLTSSVNDPFAVCPAGFEPATFSSGG